MSLTGFSSQPALSPYKYFQQRPQKNSSEGTNINQSDGQFELTRCQLSIPNGEGPPHIQNGWHPEADENQT